MTNPFFLHNFFLWAAAMATYIVASMWISFFTTHKIKYSCNLTSRLSFITMVAFIIFIIPTTTAGLFYTPEDYTNFKKYMEVSK